MPRWLSVIAWLAFAWVAANCVYVYGFLGGQHEYRIETALFVLLAVLLAAVVRRRGNVAAATAPLTRRTSLTLIVLAAALFAAMHATLLAFPFLSDDYVFLGLYGDAPRVLDAPQFFRPMYAFVFWALAQIGGGTPVVFHVLKLLLHGSSAFFVYVLTRRVTGADAAALVASVIFLLHPFQLEVVLWVSGLQDGLAAFFVLAALVTYTSRREISWPMVIATTLLMAAALLSKESAVSVIAVLAAFDLVCFRFARGPVLRYGYLAFAATLAAYALIRSATVALEPGFAAAPSRYFLKQFLTMPYRVFAQPWNDAVIVMPAIVPIVLGLAIVGVIVYAVTTGRVGTRVLLGPFIVLVTALPVWSYFFVSPELAGARYLYLPAFGWALLMGELLAATLRRPRALVAATTAVIVTSCAFLLLNLRPWRTAAETIAGLQRRVAAGEPLPADIPQTILGAPVLTNGKEEFVELVRQKRIQ